MSRKRCLWCLIKVPPFIEYQMVSYTASISANQVIFNQPSCFTWLGNKAGCASLSLVLLRSDDIHIFRINIALHKNTNAYHGDRGVAFTYICHLGTLKTLVSLYCFGKHKTPPRDWTIIPRLCSRRTEDEREKKPDDIFHMTLKLHE